MGRTKERLTGSEWCSNLMCIKVPRGLIKAPLLLQSPSTDFTRSGWGLRIFISTSSQVRLLLLLLWGSHFENHWLRGSGPTPEKSQFWGNSLWHPLKYLRILAPSFARPKPSDHHITHVRLSLQGGQL